MSKNLGNPSPLLWKTSADSPGNIVKTLQSSPALNMNNTVPDTASPKPPARPFTQC